MFKDAMNSTSRRPKLSGEAGISMLEVLIVFVLIAILSTVALINFQRSNRNFNLSGSTRAFASYLEKARLDSIRRHGVGGNASIVLNSATSYTVNIDFSGTGATTARTINLPAGTTFSYTLPPAATSINPGTVPVTIAYDWRGRTTSGNTLSVTLTDAMAANTSSNVIVGFAGDVSTDTTVTGPVTNPTPQNTTVSITTGIKSMH
jgi:type II secretory pathway pseudopilin PulG